MIANAFMQVVLEENPMYSASTIQHPEIPTNQQTPCIMHPQSSNPANRMSVALGILLVCWCTGPLFSHIEQGSYNKASVVNHDDPIRLRLWFAGALYQQHLLVYGAEWIMHSPLKVQRSRWCFAKSHALVKIAWQIDGILCR